MASEDANQKDTLQIGFEVDHHLAEQFDVCLNFKGYNTRSEWCREKVRNFVSETKREMEEKLAAEEARTEE